MLFLIIVSTVSYPAMASEFVDLRIDVDEVPFGEDATVYLSASGKETDVKVSVPVDVVLVIDVSGSMRYNVQGDELEDLATNERRLGIAREAANSFIDLLSENPNNRVGIVTLGHEAEIVKGLTPLSQASSIKRAVSSLKACGGTNYYLPLVKAKDLLASEGKQGNQKAIIFLSDGKPTTSNTESPSDWEQCNFRTRYSGRETVDGDSYQCSGTYYKDPSESRCSGGYADMHDIQAALAGSNQVKQEGISLFTIGFGNAQQLDGSLLRQMASDPSYFNFAGSQSGLESIYEEISTTITNTVANDVVVNLQLPEGLLFSGVHAEQSTASKPVGFSASDGILSWDIGALAKGEQVGMSFVVEPQRPGTFPVGGSNAIADYTDPYQSQTSEYYPEAQLKVIDPKPVVESVELYKGSSCAELLPSSAPFSGKGCLKAIITDDDLDSAQADLSAFGAATTEGRCKKLTSAAIPYEYECIFNNIDISIPRAGAYAASVIATDVNGNSASGQQSYEFGVENCSLDLGFSLRGTPDHSVTATVSKGDSQVTSKTFTRSTGAPKVEHMRIDAQGTDEITLFLQGGPYPAAGNPLFITVNGKKLANLPFNVQQDTYTLSLSLGEQMGTANICKEQVCISSEEVCDGSDNDCDGLVDEYAVTEHSSPQEGALCGTCTPGETKTCDTFRKGECGAGEATCIRDPKTGIPEWSECTTDYEPQPEVCNSQYQNCCDGLDNDCNGKVDERSQCADDICEDGETRSCMCDCEDAQVLIILDDNHHNEDLADFDQIYNDLLELGIDVRRVDEAELAGHQ
ncbi:MAG: VWA domain-containing protein, partial [Nanoarchaeota archaeon]